MIRSLADPETNRIWNGQCSRKLPPDIQNFALRNKRVEMARICIVSMKSVISSVLHNSELRP